jgi:amino acid permease
MILGIIINCGGVPTDNRGYIGTTYWYDPTSMLTYCEANSTIQEITV